MRAQRAARTGQGTALVCANVECSPCESPVYDSSDTRGCFLQSQLKEQQRKAEAGRQHTDYFERYCCCYSPAPATRYCFGPWCRMMGTSIRRLLRCVSCSRGSESSKQSAAVNAAGDGPVRSCLFTSKREPLTVQGNAMGLTVVCSACVEGNSSALTQCMTGMSACIKACINARFANIRPLGHWQLFWW